MKFRSASSHSICTECYKHKALISALSRHISARRTQESLYHQHLEDQFRDRICYWEARGESRSQSSRVTLIIDGMDQGKFGLPRHKSVNTKALSGFQRPRLHVAAAICHGHFISAYVTDGDLCKDSNTSMEMLSHCLDMLGGRISLHTCDLVIQCDNTYREVKNNHIFRWAAAVVSCGLVRSLTVSSLRSGHSHEDIDQLFGQIATFLKTQRSRMTPEDFVDSLKVCLSGLQRPFEKERHVWKLDQTRDWFLGLAFSKRFAPHVTHHLTNTTSPPQSCPADIFK